MESKQLNRRHFLLWGCSALCAAALGSGCTNQQTSDNQTNSAVQATATVQSASSPTRITRCPRGLVNDPYPGRCHNYVDKNNNRICDLSESA